MKTKTSTKTKSSNGVKAHVSSSSFCAGAKVECINDSGLPDYIKKMGVLKGKTFIVREIGEKSFHGDGGGLRLQGITLYSDLTGFEKCFKRNRFKVVAGGKK